MVEVTTGMQNDNEVEILSGLQEGATVYYTETINPFAMMFQAMGGGNMGNMGGNQRPGGNMGSQRPYMGGRQGG